MDRWLNNPFMFLIMMTVLVLGVAHIGEAVGRKTGNSVVERYFALPMN